MAHNFFRILRDSWGHFICLNAYTVNRSRLDVARMLVKVGSSLYIPSSVSVSVGGFMHKIIVVVKDSPVVGEAEGVSDKTVAVPTRTPSLEVPNARLTAFSSREREVPIVPIFGCLLEHGLHHADVVFGSYLSEGEMKGGSPLESVHAHSLMTLGDHVIVRSELVGQADNAFSTDLLRDLVGVGPYIGLSANGLSGMSPNDMEFGLVSHCINDASEFFEASLQDVDKSI